MTWVVAVLAVIVALLTLFVLGLLRAHAELLERLAALEDETDAPGARSMPAGVVPAPESIPSAELAFVEGVDCELEPYRLDVAAVPTPYLLVAFLSTSCFSCLDIWRDIVEDGMQASPVTAGDDAATLVIALKGREQENLGKAMALAAESPVPVVLSNQAWAALEVPGSPYFALVSTQDRRVMGAGSAQSWEQLRSLASDGMLELSVADRKGGGYRSIIEREDADLMRAGIYPGHPSLTAPLMDPDDTTAHERTGEDAA